MTTSMPHRIDGGATAASSTLAGSPPPPKGCGATSVKAAQVSMNPARAISGTATRSARPTARGPHATMSVAATPMAADQTHADPGPPSSCEHTEAAMVLLTAIQAKFVR